MTHGRVFHIWLMVELFTKTQKGSWKSHRQPALARHGTPVLGSMVGSKHLLSHLSDAASGRVAVGAQSYPNTRSANTWFTQTVYMTIWGYPISSPIFDYFGVPPFMETPKSVHHPIILNDPRSKSPELVLPLRSALPRPGWWQFGAFWAKFWWIFNYIPLEHLNFQNYIKWYVKCTVTIMSQEMQTFLSQDFLSTLDRSTSLPA